MRPKLPNQKQKQTPKQQLGKAGEQRAIEFLLHKGYSILDTNFSMKFGEIDIIAQDRDEIVFVEVKTRTESYGIHPSEAVDSRKLERIFQTGAYYLQWHNLNADYRCDIITLLPETIEHFENVSLE
ncbi:MAG: YraN family protein [Patescibacteria group bacterium]